MPDATLNRRIVRFQARGETLIALITHTPLIKGMEVHPPPIKELDYPKTLIFIVFFTLHPVN